MASSQPHGREEIVAAVIDAATSLFAERGPAAVSLRDVATAAKVTLSQIHRHIGNKEQLLVAVLTAEVAVGGPPAAPVDLSFEAFLGLLFQLDGPSLRTKLQARIILDGYDLRALQDRYPGIELGIELLKTTLPEDEARFRAGLLAAFLAGWQLLGPSYLQIAGLEDLTPERFVTLVQPLLHGIATAPPATENS